MVTVCECGGEAKYRCPGCSRRTCSVSCVNAHKTKYRCTGKQVRTSYTSLAEFDTPRLISDYKFLEGVKTFLDRSRRDDVVYGTKSLATSRRLRARIKKHCFNNDIIYRYLPDSFTKFLENQSTMNKSELHWYIELFFKDRNTRICLANVSEDTILSNIKDSNMTGSLISFSEQRFIHQYFGKNTQASFLYKANNFSKEAYYELDLSKSIKENLKFKTVLEYPTIVISSSLEDLNIVECAEVNVKDVISLPGKEDGTRHKPRQRKRNRKRGKNEDIYPVKKSCGNPFQNTVLELFDDDDYPKDEIDKVDRDKTSSQVGDDSQKVRTDCENREDNHENEIKSKSDTDDEDSGNILF